MLALLVLATVASQATVAANQYIYVGGADLGDGTMEVDRFDPVAATWARAVTPPIPRRLNAWAGTLAGRIFIIGGASAAETLEVTLSSDFALSLAVVPGAATRAYAFGVGVVGSKAYIVGGADAESVGPGPTGIQGRMDVFDGQTSEMARSVGPGMSVRRMAHAVAAMGTTLYAIGGQTTGNQIISAVEVCDTTQGTWSAGPSLNIARTNAAAALLDRTIYVFGGTGVGGITMASVEYLVGGSWVQAAESMHASRASMACVVLGSTVYLMGGVHSEGGNPVASVEQSTVELFAGGQFSYGPSMPTASSSSVALAPGVNPNPFAPDTTVADAPRQCGGRQRRRRRLI